MISLFLDYGSSGSHTARSVISLLIHIFKANYQDFRPCGCETIKRIKEKRSRLLKPDWTVHWLDVSYGDLTIHSNFSYYVFLWFRCYWVLLGSHREHVAKYCSPRGHLKWEVGCAEWSWRGPTVAIKKLKAGGDNVALNIKRLAVRLFPKGCSAFSPLSKEDVAYVPVAN